MDPKKNIIPTGTPSREVLPLRSTLIPFIQVSRPIVNGMTSATQSHRLVSPSLRRATMRPNQIKGKNPAANITVLVFDDRQVCGRRPHRQHRRNKHPPGQHMPSRDPLHLHIAGLL